VRHLPTIRPPWRRRQHPEVPRPEGLRSMTCHPTGVMNAVTVPSAVGVRVVPHRPVGSRST
jgi:hypothetical protein